MKTRNPDRGEPWMRIEADADGTIVGFDPGFGPDLAAMVVARRNPNGSITIRSTKTWDPTKGDANG